MSESGSSSKAAVKEEESKSGEESSSDEMQVEDSGPVVVSTNTERSYLLFPIKLDVALDNNTRLKEAFMWTVCCTTTKETYDNGTVRTKYIEYTIHDEQALEIFVIRMCEDLDLPPYSDKKVMNTVLEQFAVLAEAANVDAEKMEREWRAYLEQQSLIEAASLAAHLDRNFVPPPGLFDVIEQLSPRFWKGATRASQRRKRAASNLDVTRVVGRPSSGARSSSGAEDMDETAAEEEEPPQDPTVDQVDPTNLDEVAKVAHLLEKSEEQRMLMKIHISIGGIEYQDQFEWEITNPPSMIEAFAKITACDLGLPREFEVALVHEMHRQVFFHRVMMAKRKVLDEIASTKSPPNVCFLLPVTAESAIRNIAIASSYEPSLRATSNQINLPPLPPRTYTPRARSSFGFPS